jgi:hypothetical protein
MVKLATISGGTLILILVSSIVEAPEYKISFRLQFVGVCDSEIRIKNTRTCTSSPQWEIVSVYWWHVDHIPKGLEIMDKERKSICSIFGS